MTFGIMKDIPKAYNAKDYEDKVYEKWEKSGFFNPDNLELDKKAEKFSISMPPPNATGVLHIGHAMMLAIEDLVIRYRRMKGDRTLWLPGTDHAAIATQTVVEKKLLREKKQTRHDLGRDKFLEEVKNFVEQSKNTIKNQVRKMGSSCDWSRERYTLDKGLSRAVVDVFARMYNDGLIYRGYRIVNWCPRCASTLADDEVEYREEKGKLYWIKYGPFVLATARPETKLGDTAVAVHPDDPRYKDMVGKKYMIPGVLGDFEIMVVADGAVDPKFGSGAIKVTPAHDFTDFEIARRHGIGMRQVIGEDGRMMANTGKYAGMTTAEAREAIVRDMEKLGLIDHIEDNYTHNVAVCYRCGTVVEPLPSRQWFIDVNKKINIGGNKYFKNKSLKEVALEVIRDGEIKIIPDRFQKTYFHWIENLRDWCISRQIWFGHRIPVWYCGGLEKAAQLKMGFHKDIVPQVFDGKTKTYRLRDHGFKVGDKVLFENSQTKTLFGFGIITEVEETTVEKINYKDPTHYQTYKSLKELIEAFKLRNPEKTVTPKSKAYLYAYEFHTFTKEDVKNGCGQIIVSVEKLEKCPACGGNNIKQDEDTLDTWFSSGLWTFSTLLDKDFSQYESFDEWVGGSQDLKQFHPTSLMETGYDILFFWVARMILMTTYTLGEIPFHKVYLHGLVRDEEGKKMSKSLGNVIDPLDMIAKYGTDAVRLSLVIGATPGNDIKLYDEKIAGFRNFANKLWNISRYVLTTVKEIKRIEKKPKGKTLADEWILARLDWVTDAASKHLDNYEFSVVGEILRDFTWGEFADWYIEISKVEKDKDEILLYILENLLKLWHPFMPFVTEVIWENIVGDGKKENLLIIQKWPEVVSKKIDKKVQDNFGLIQKIIVAIRNLRAENKIEVGKKIKAIIYGGIKTDLIKKQIEVIKRLSGLGELEISEKGKKPEKAIGTVVEKVEIYLPLAGIVDLEKEKNRIKKEIESIKKYILEVEKKITNKEFLAKAPKEIVESEKEKLNGQKEKLEKLEDQLKNLI